MGMYDYINGEQVKCFYRPIFSENEGLWHSGGLLRSYADGDELPLTTMYYKYPNNFMIFDYMDYNDECFIHIIKEGKVYKTCTLKDMKNEYFKDNKLVVTYYGSAILNLKSVEDMVEYIKDTKEHNLKIKEIRKDSRLAHDEFMKSFRVLEKLKKIKNSKEIFELIASKHFNSLKDLFKTKDIELNDEFIKEVKTDELLKDEDFMNKLYELLECEMKKEFYELADKHDIELKKAEEKMKPFDISYSNKWYLKDEFYLEKKFGEYLDTIIYLFEAKDEGCTILDNKKNYESCKELLSKFIKDNEDIRDKYIKWLELDEECIEGLNEVLSQTVYS